MFNMAETKQLQNTAGIIYLSVCFFSLGQMGQWGFERFVIASGKSQLFIFTLSAASIINIILDPVFIFGLNLGTKGAAFASVIGQFVGMGAEILINRRWNKEIPFKFTLHPDFESIKTIIKVGFPSTLVQVLTGFVNVAMNTILLVSIPDLVVSSTLQGLSRAKSSMVIALLRQVILPLMFAWGLSKLRQVNLMWLGFLLAEVIMIYPAVMFWKHNFQKIF